jgi:predicted methyltransferase
MFNYCACLLLNGAGALSVGGLLLATGVGIGYTAMLAIIEAAAISNMVSPHVVELVQSGEYAQVLSDVVGGAVNSVSPAAADASAGASGSGPADGGEDGITK